MLNRADKLWLSSRSPSPTFDRTRFFLCDLIENRRDHFARAAPFRPKIDEDRLIALGYFGFKIGFSQSYSAAAFHIQEGKSKVEQ